MILRVMWLLHVLMSAQQVLCSDTPMSGDNDGKTNLYVRRQKNNYSSVVVLDNKALFNILLAHQNPKILNKNNRGETLVHTTIKYRRDAMFSDLLQQTDIDLNAQTHDGQTAAHYAVFHNSPRSLISLAFRKADLNRADYEGKTPLMLAVQLDRQEIVKLLLQLKFSPVDIHARNNNGLQALHYAKSLPIAQALLAQGADVHAKSRYGHTPAAMAVLHKQPEVLALLKNHGSAVDYTSDTGKNLLFFARDIDSAKILLSEGVDLCARDKDYQTPLHAIASKTCDANMIDLYLQQGAYIEYVNIYGLTPLHVVSRPHIAKALLAHGAPVNYAYTGRIGTVTLEKKTVNPAGLLVIEKRDIHRVGLPALGYHLLPENHSYVINKDGQKYQNYRSSQQYWPDIPEYLLKYSEEEPLCVPDRPDRNKIETQCNFLDKVVKRHENYDGSVSNVTKKSDFITFAREHQERLKKSGEQLGMVRSLDTSLGSAGVIEDSVSRSMIVTTPRSSLFTTMQQDKKPNHDSVV
jgi:ankyrin repeat protein